MWNVGATMAVLEDTGRAKCGGRCAEHGSGIDHKRRYMPASQRQARTNRGGCELLSAPCTRAGNPNLKPNQKLANPMHESKQWPTHAEGHARFEVPSPTPVTRRALGVTKRGMRTLEQAPRQRCV